MLAAVPLLAVAVVDGAAVLGRHSGESAARHDAAPRVTQRHADTEAAEAQRRAVAARTHAIRELLARRGDAVLHHDRREWRLTLDPGSPKFRRRQMQVFDNLHKVRFASWSYSFEANESQLPGPPQKKYAAPTWAPLGFSLNYRLRGFDKRPTNLPQYPTFVNRGGSWYLASFSDFAKRGMRSALDLWDFGPVEVLRTPSVLVLGHPESMATMQGVAAEVAADIPRVSAVWGEHWSQHAVVLVPSTQQELGRVVDDYGSLDNIAAVATAEVQIGSGKPDPVGDRIGINPANWPKLSPLGRRIVLTHELTHVATRAVTSAATPTWLAEGFADYVGYLGSGVPTTFVAQDLGNDLRAGQEPRHLPRDGQFDGRNVRLSQSYEGAWLACRLIAERWGQRTLVRLYDAVGRSHEQPAAAVASALQRFLHLSQPEFTKAWRAYLSTELT